MRLSTSPRFKRLMISYFAILLFPILISALIYNRASNLLQKNAMASSSNTLNNVKELIEKEVISIDQAILDLSIKPELRKIINMESPQEGSPDMYWFYEFYKMYNNIGSLVSRNKIFLFINTNETVFTENYANFNFHDFYTEYFTYDHYSYKQWYEQYFEGFYYRNYIPSQRVTINGVTKEYITALYTIPITKKSISMRTGQGVIAYLYDVEEVQKFLGRMVSENQGWAYILDKEGQVLYSTSPKQFSLVFDENKNGNFVEEIEGEQNLVVYAQSDILDWKFVSVIPKNLITQDLNQLRYMSLMIGAIILFIGMIFAFILSYYNVKSIYEILELLPGMGVDGLNNKKNELARIQNEIKMLITDNHRMQDSVTRQHHYLKVMYLERLLRGNIQAEEELQIALKYLNFNQGKFYVAILIRIGALSSMQDDQMTKEQDLYRVVLDEVLTGATGAAGHIHIINQNDMTLLLEVNEEESHQHMIADVIRQVEIAFKAHFTILPLFAIGELYDNLLDLYLSLREATYAAEMVLLENRKETIIWYKELQHDAKGYYYTDDVEQRIINLTKMGDWEELKLALKKIYVNTLRNKHTNYEINRILLNDLYATLVKISFEINIEIDLMKLNNCNRGGNIEKFYKALKEEFEKICSKLSGNKKTHNQEMIQEMIRYIQEDFYNQNLSLSLIACRFNLSESYFSQFFKEQTHHTFSRYLEDTRIKYAIELLLQEEITLEEIATKCGYNNSNTFRRAFRRVTGLSPSAYVKANQLIDPEIE